MSNDDANGREHKKSGGFKACSAATKPMPPQGR